MAGRESLLDVVLPRSCFQQSGCDYILFICLGCAVSAPAVLCCSYIRMDGWGGLASLAFITLRISYNTLLRPTDRPTGPLVV
jgi:hypothetical protein